MPNITLNNNFLKKVGLVAFIPKFKMSRKRVVRGISQDFTLEEIKNAVKNKNVGLKIVNLFRLKKRNKLTKILEESQNICIEIKGETLPQRLVMLKTINTVFPYIPTVRLCYKCGHLGHISKFCEKPETCLNCGGAHLSSKDNPCSMPASCINCKGHHGTLHKGCPAYVKQLEIHKIMAVDNLPFLEARKLRESNIKEPQTFNLQKSLSNFPLLPEKPTNRSVATTSSWFRNADFSIDHLAKERRRGDPKISFNPNLFGICNEIMAAPECETLIDRIRRTIDLHIKNINDERKKTSKKGQ
ncbi:uncharacterized protein [Cardiocondyla obscurior]|uniref:uncharacterized protein n=1 Tax=Cardiocondyla obscurior TaxID=286306 RepID=UPI0039658634